MTEFINIGYGNLVAKSRIVSVLSPDAAPVKRLISESKQTGNLVDASCGKKTCAVIVTDTKLIILSALSCEALESALNTTKNTENTEN
jgi:regulator of extracellular matrix RemA (YlzA/DUF370 family)